MYDSDGFLTIPRASAATVCGVCWLGNHIPEVDLLEAGDGAFVAPGVDVFTHDQENWRYTYGPVTIGARCIVGERSSLMGNSRMDEGSQLLPKSQGLKNAVYASGCHCAGNPAGIVTQKVAEATVGPTYSYQPSVGTRPADSTFRMGLRARLASSGGRASATTGLDDLECGTDLSIVSRQ